MTNKRSPKKLTAGIALVTAGALALAGCGPSEGSDTAGSGDEVELTFSSWLPTQDQWQELIAAFEEENPNIKIKFDRNEDYEAYLTNLDNDILAGEVPDLFGIQVGSSFDDYAEFAKDTGDYAGDWIDGLNAEALDQTTTTDGEVAAVPLLLAGMEFYLYNQTIFDELSLDLPTDYESLLEVSEAAREAGYSPFAMGASDAWHDADFFVWLATQYGEGDEIYQAAAGDIPWDSQPLVDAGAKWQDLFNDGVFQTGATSTDTYPTARDDYFLAGKSIALPTGSWHVGAALSTSPEVPGSAVEGDEIGMAVFPPIGDTDRGVTSGVDFAIAMSDEIDDSKVDAAAKFIEFMAVGTGQQLWVNTLQGFPAATDISVELGPEETDLGVQSVDLVTEALQASTHARKPLSPGNDGLESDLGIVLQNIAEGADPAKELASLNQ